MNTQTLDVLGLDGRTYRYFLHPVGTAFKAAPGNYLFVRQNPIRLTSYEILYGGETGDLSERFDNHHKMPIIRSRGATHIAVHTSSSAAEVRRAEESAIVLKYQPVCNG